MLGLLVNTLTADYMYSRHSKENFEQQIQMELSIKLKIFSGLFIAFLKSMSNSEYFEKKIGSHSLSIFEITHSKREVYVNI